MSMFMTINESNPQTLTKKSLEDVEYYVTKMQDSGSRVEIKTVNINRRNLDMSLPEGNVIEVTCGHLVGYLHRDRFYCPGIHRECIEVDGEFVTPKKFSVLGDKQRLKDWKNAIRINNRQIRKYIDSGELTFWNHDSLCTGRCIARAPAIRPGTGIPVRSENDKKCSYSFETLTSSMSPAPDVPSQVSMLVPEDISGAKGDDGDWESNDVKPDVNELQAQMMAATKLQPIITHPHPVVSNIPSLTTMPKSPSYTYPICSSSVSSGHALVGEESSDEDDRMLWKGIVELGLVDEFFREIKAALDVFKNDMIRRYVPLDASKKISIIVKELGLMSKLRYKLGAHKSDMDRQRQKLDREMEDLQRRVKEYELKKAMLKRKSECFDQLIDITTLKKDESTEEQVVTPVKLIKTNEDTPTPMIIFPSQIVIPSSDSVAITVADSNSAREPVNTEKVVYLKTAENSDDQNEGTDCESSEMEQNSNVDSESNQESTSAKGDNCRAEQEDKEGDNSNVDSTTNEPFGNPDVDNSSSAVAIESESQNDFNTNDNATSEKDSKIDDFTGIRSSKRKRMPKTYD